MSLMESINCIKENIKTLYKNYSKESEIEKSFQNAISEQPPSKAKILFRELFNGGDSIFLERLQNIWKNKSNNASKALQDLIKEILLILECRKQNTVNYLSKSLKDINDFSSGKDFTDANVIDSIIKILAMEKLPTKEQGWFKEMSRNITVDENGEIKSVTEIFYLLEVNEVYEQVSSWHALFSDNEEENIDETWTWIGGNTLCLFQLEDQNGETKIMQTLLNETSREHVIKDGVLFGAKIENCSSNKNAFSLVTCKCISAFLFDRYKDPRIDMPEKWETLVQLYLKNVKEGNCDMASIIKQLIPTEDFEQFESDINESITRN